MFITHYIGVVANVLDCYIVVSEFKLKLCYYIYFQSNTLGNGMNSLLPLAGLNSTTIVFLQGWL